jgi:hypothetical protein
MGIGQCEGIISRSDHDLVNDARDQGPIQVAQGIERPSDGDHFLLSYLRWEMAVGYAGETEVKVSPFGFLTLGKFEGYLDA